MSQTKNLENEIDQYLQFVMTSGMLFYEGVKEFFNDQFDHLIEHCIEIKKIEHEADQLKKSIKFKLYSQMLIPESRGDVLGLLETLDDVINESKNVLLDFEIEQPHIPPSLHADFVKIGYFSANAIKELVRATNAYFTNIHNISEPINQVLFYEHEVDKIYERIKRKIFLDKEVERFSYRMHINQFAVLMSGLTDTAEQACERISISAIKRSL